jgi:uncharacterized protein (DUF2384 family)
MIKSNKVFTEFIKRKREVFEHGISIFGTEEKFKRWLSQDNPFNPISSNGVANTDSVDGLDIIDDELTRIEHGNTA